VKIELNKITAKRDCGVVGLWRKSTLNHMYCVAGAAADESRIDRVEAMWISLANHIHNIHKHDNPLYAMCNHPPIPDDDLSKEWLVPSEFKKVL